MLLFVLAIALQALWSFDAGSHIWATPAVAYGHVYVGSSNGDLFALDERTGALIWEAHLRASANFLYGFARGIVGGVAVDGNVVYAASASCVAAAFDAQTGLELWRTKICSTAANDDVYAAPVVASGLVLIGIDVIGDDPTSRGREIALDAATGKRRWTFSPVRYAGTGSGISTRAAVDAAEELAVIGTGNPTPMNSPPPGPDPGSDSIIALDAHYGSVRWSYGPVYRHDTQDRDMFASPNLFQIGGRKAVGEIGKDGVYYTLDEQTGRLVWKRVLQLPGYYTLAIGTPAEGDGLIFVPLYSPGSGRRSVGAIVALDERTGVTRWRFAGAGMYEAPVYARGDVYVTQTTGRLDALDASTGALLARVTVRGKLFGHGPAYDDGRLFVAHSTRVTAYGR
jgi:outer membrane protein assembly factor BamB